MKIIQPDSLLSNLKKVEEKNLYPFPVGLISLFIFNKLPSNYTTKILTYENNNTLTEKTTVTHRFVQGAYTILGLGLVYTGYSFLKSLLPITL